MRKKLYKIAQAAILGIAMVFTFSCSSDLEEQLKNPNTGGENSSSPSEQSSSSYREAETADFVGIWRGANNKEGYIFLFTSDGKYIRSPEIDSPDDAVIQMAANGKFGNATLKYTINGSEITFEKYNQVQCITTPCDPLDQTTNYQISFTPDPIKLILEFYEPITLRKISSATLPSSSSALSSSSSIQECDDCLRLPTADFVGIWRGGNTKEGYIFIFTSDGKYVRSPEINSPDDAIIEMAAAGFFGPATLKYTVNGSIISFEKYEQVQCFKAPCDPIDQAVDYQFIFKPDSIVELYLAFYNPITLRKLSN